MTGRSIYRLMKGWIDREGGGEGGDGRYSGREGGRKEARVMLR